MGLNLDYIPDQTIIPEEEKEALLIPSVTTHKELHEFEQLNFEKALEWSIKKRFTLKTVFTEDFIKQLHKKMLGDVWKTAGTFRVIQEKRAANESPVAAQLKKLIEDTLLSIIKESYPPEEITLRFMRRLALIKCFRNGNDRHSRLLADIIISDIFKKPVFSWSIQNRTDKKSLREQYQQALQEADEGDFTSLIDFARS